MSLNEAYTHLLSKIIAKHGYEYDDFMFNFGTAAFPDWKIDELCSWVNDEFMLNGLLEDGEPNEYGGRLEKLLDTVNRQRLKSR